MINTRDLVEIIESDDLAFDILLGNTPRDMYFRAKDNEKFKIIEEAVENDPNIIEKIILRFKYFIEKEDEDLGRLGKFIAYLAVFSVSKSREVYNLLVELSEKTTKDHFAYEILSIVLDEVRAKLESSSDLINKNMEEDFSLLDFLEDSFDASSETIDLVDYYYPYELPAMEETRDKNISLVA